MSLMLTGAGRAGAGGAIGPTVSSTTVEADGVTVTVVFSAAVTWTGTGSGTVSGSGGGGGAITYVSGDGTDTLTFSAAAVYEHETCLLNMDAGAVTDGTNPNRTVTNGPVTNNSTLAPAAIFADSTLASPTTTYDPATRSATGGTDTAYPTLNGALAVAHFGGTVYARGTFQETANNSGTSTAYSYGISTGYVTVAAYPGDPMPVVTYDPLNPPLSGGGAGVGYRGDLIQIFAVGVTLSGLNIIGTHALGDPWPPDTPVYGATPTGSCVYVQHTGSVTVTGCWLQQWDHCGAKWEDTAGPIIVEYCDVDSSSAGWTGYDNNLYAHSGYVGGSARSKIRYNFVHDGPGDGIQCYDLTVNTDVYGNLVWNCGSQGATISGANGTFYNNTIIACGLNPGRSPLSPNGAHGGVEIWSQTISGWVVENNILRGNYVHEAPGDTLESSSTVGDTVIRNNLVGIPSVAWAAAASGDSTTDPLLVGGTTPTSAADLVPYSDTPAVAFGVMVPGVEILDSADTSWPTPKAGSDTTTAGAFTPAAVPRPPVANFTGTPRSGAAPLSVAFTDSSTFTPTSWHWEKNDGGGWVDFAGTPTDQNPTESFAAGTWSVRLTASNAGGSDTLTRTDYVASGAPADPFVQGAHTGAGNGTSAVTLAYPSDVTAGNILVVAVATYNDGVTATVEDTQGNTYAQAGSYAISLSTGGVRASIWVATAGSTGANTVSVTPSPSAYVGYAIAEYDAAVVTATVSASATATGTGTDVDTGAVTVGAADSLVICAACDNAGGTQVFTAGSGFTLRENETDGSNHVAMGLEDQVASANVNGTMTLPVSADWAAVAAVLAPV